MFTLVYYFCEKLNTEGWRIGKHYREETQNELVSRRFSEETKYGGVTNRSRNSFIFSCVNSFIFSCDTNEHPQKMNKQLFPVLIQDNIYRFEEVSAQAVYNY